MSMQPFFRPEVLQAKQNQWTGKVLLTRPFSFVFFTWCAIGVAACIVAFLFWGSYTNKTTVEGQLLPTSGVVRVYPTEIGIIAERFVEEGSLVQAGDPLFRLATPRFGNQGNVQAQLVVEAKLKKILAEQELARQKRIQQNETDSLKNTIVRLENQIAHIKQQIISQNRRIQLAEQILQKYRHLAQQDAVSQQEMLVQETDVLEQKSRLGNLKREEDTLIRELNEQNIALKNLPERHQTEISQLSRDITQMNQEILDFDVKSEQIIRASKSGYVSAMNVEVGQQVSPNQLLLGIVPEQTELLANLYVPSRTVGFVKPHDKVVLRYQAFPYQKFGHANGKIVSVAKTALGKQELSGLGLIFSDINSLNEPAYLVKVKLNKQTVLAYGKEKNLQIGMILEADILHENKKLYEWVLDPLYSISGKLN